MRTLLTKLVLFLAIWYEVTVELGLSGGTACAVTLLAGGAAMTLLRLPLQLLAMIGPRAVVIAAPALVWFALAAWLSPGLAWSTPVFTLATGAVLAVAGAALRYAVNRYPRFFARRIVMLRAVLVPLASLALGLLVEFPVGVLSVAAMAVLIGMPLRIGWRIIPPLAPHKFDARMGDAEGFRHAGYREER